MPDSIKKAIVFLSLASLIFLGSAGFLFPQQSAQVSQTGSLRNSNVLQQTGVRIENIMEGNGKTVATGDEVSIHYSGEFENGEVFDSSYGRGEPLSFIVGVGQVIPGMEEGILGMRVGGQRKIIIPSELGYGEQGVPGIIPPSATLIFTIELVRAESTGDGGRTLDISQ